MVAEEHSAVFSLPEIQCPSPRSPGALWAGGPKQFYMYTDTLTIECPRGYTVTGPNVISCGLDGQWHPQPPSCIRTGRWSPPTPAVGRHFGYSVPDYTIFTYFPCLYFSTSAELERLTDISEYYLFTTPPPPLPRRH